MAIVGSYDAKTNLPKLLERVEKQGERITITRHGRPIAMIVPVESRSSEEIKSAVERLKERRKARSLGASSIRELIEEGRRF